ncbi:MAG: ribonuclease T2 [Devosia sp.]
MLAVAIAGLLPTEAVAQEVDHYVLSLSWSPSYCAREGDDAPNLQCGADKDFGFIVHGLWPNTANDTPSFCHNRPRNPPRRVVNSMLDIMPSRGLIRHQWRKHGTCSGLSQSAYFDTVRRAYEAVEIPPRLEALEADISVAPEVMRAAFRAINPTLPEDGIYVRCRGPELVDVRLCLTPDLAFRGCPRVRDKRCRTRLLDVPAPR